MIRQFHIDGTLPGEGQIFVFGSNLSGAHYGGAARAAMERFGAEWGALEGLTGQSYAIPTMSENAEHPLKLETIGHSIKSFIRFASYNPQQKFFVTRIGCGIAGHQDSDIAPLFCDATSNCSFPDRWKEYLTHG